MVEFLNDWDGLLADELQKPYFQNILAFLNKEYRRTQCYPPPQQVVPRPARHALWKSTRRHPRPGPVPRSRSGPRPVFLRQCGRAAAAVAGKYLCRAARGPGLSRASKRRSERLGRAGRAAAQYDSDRSARTADEPCGHWLADVYRPRHRTFKRPGKAHCVPALGLACARKKNAAHQSRAPDPRSAAPKPAFGWPRLFWLPALLQGQRLPSGARRNADRLAATVKKHFSCLFRLHVSYC